MFRVARGTPQTVTRHLMDTNAAFLFIIIIIIIIITGSDIQTCQHRPWGTPRHEDLLEVPGSLFWVFSFLV